VKAVVQSGYGHVDDVLRVEEIDEPRAGERLVLVGVRAASMHPDVWHAVTGRPYVLRVMGSGLRRPTERVPGTDVAGVVDAVGPGVTRFRPGDEVYGEVVAGNQWRNGGAFAERVAVPEQRLAPMPQGLEFDRAAAVPTSALIALRAVRSEGRVHEGQRVLVNGAGGGVGNFAVQIATALGADVTAVDLGEKVSMLRSIGAVHAIDAGTEDFTGTGDRYDVIVDIPGNRAWKDLARALAPDGTYVLVGHDGFGASAGRWFGSLGRFVRLFARSPFDRRIPGVRTFTDPEQDPMAVLGAMLATGAIVPTVDRTFPLEQVVEAIHYLETGSAFGKIVLTVGDGA
jgi:NADPH:quinone reductase-like Zn-dependent oxidoreductase